MFVTFLKKPTKHVTEPKPILTKSAENVTWPKINFVRIRPRSFFLPRRSFSSFFRGFDVFVLLVKATALNSR